MSGILLPSACCCSKAHPESNCYTPRYGSIWGGHQYDQAYRISVKVDGGDEHTFAVALPWVLAGDPDYYDNFYGNCSWLEALPIPPSRSTARPPIETVAVFPFPDSPGPNGNSREYYRNPGYYPTLFLGSGLEIKLLMATMLPYMNYRNIYDPLNGLLCPTFAVRIAVRGMWECPSHVPSRIENAACYYFSNSQTALACSPLCEPSMVVSGGYEQDENGKMLFPFSMTVQTGFWNGNGSPFPQETFLPVTYTVSRI